MSINNSRVKSKAEKKMFEEPFFLFHNDDEDERKAKRVGRLFTC